MLSSTLSEDEDLDMDATDYSQYASTGAENPQQNSHGHCACYHTCLMLHPLVALSPPALPS